MVDIVDLGSADAEGVLAGISKAIDSLGLTFEQLKHIDHDNPNLLMVNFDGASVNFGNKTGVVKRIKESVSDQILAVYMLYKGSSLQVGFMKSRY